MTTTAATVTARKGGRGVDSAQRLAPAQIRAVGATFTCRYYAPLVNGKRSWKALTPAEIAELHGAGIGIVPNWESSAARPLAGASAGSADGREFARQLGIDAVPFEALVVVSCDMNATAANRAAVEAYFRAALSELRRASYFNVGVYGDTDLFDWLADLDPRPVGWLIGARSFSDGTKRGASLWQRLQGAWGHNLGGVPDSVYDPNDVLADVAGIWLPHDDVDDVQPAPHPVPIPQEVGMAFIIRNTDSGEVASIDAGYAVGLSGATYSASSLPKMDVSADEWAQYVAVSSQKKAADAAMAKFTGAGGGVIPQTLVLSGQFSGTAQA